MNAEWAGRLEAVYAKPGNTLAEGFGKADLILTQRHYGFENTDLQRYGLARMTQQCGHSSYIRTRACEGGCMVRARVHRRSLYGPDGMEQTGKRLNNQF